MVLQDDRERKGGRAGQAVLSRFPQEPEARRVLTSRSAGTGLWKALASLKLTLACLAALMVLVIVCTLSQVHLGTFEAVDRTIRTFLVWWKPVGWARPVPVFPGGGLVGAVLLANLIAAHVERFELSSRKFGLWLVHAGLIFLFLGEFVTAFYAVETQMAIDEGATRSYGESPREKELAIIDASDPAFDGVISVPERLLKKEGRIDLPGRPFALLVKRYYENASLEPRPAGAPPSLATSGPGTRLAVRAQPPVAADDQTNEPAAFVEAVAGDASLGTWLLSPALGAPQGFGLEGRSYRLALRPKRHYLPFSLTLKKFRHDRYPGTDIPRNFSSLVRLVDASKGEDRDVLISMNNPLRYGGRTFYQASFGKGDTMTVLQVVENPGWRLPYLSCALVAFGLLLHFLKRLRMPA